MKTEEIIKVSTNGQITIPFGIRKRLHLDEYPFVSIIGTQDGAFICPVEVRSKSPYTKEELQKIEKLAYDEKNKGKVFGSSKEAMGHLRSL